MMGSTAAQYSTIIKARAIINEIQQIEDKDDPTKIAEIVPK